MNLISQFSEGCKEYVEERKNLIENLKNATDDQEKAVILDAFAEIHLMERYFWNKLNDYTNKKMTGIIYEKAIFHFFHTISFSNKLIDHLNLIYRTDITSIYKTIKNFEYFIYPNFQLADDNVLRSLKRVMPYPLKSSVLDKYEKARNLYLRIMEANDDDEKWFKCIQEWDDEEFVIQNIEYRISHNICNKNLWKIYIEYWRFKNPKIMLGVYSRYCSFFLDDFVMKNEYEEEAKKLEIVIGDKLLDYIEFRSWPSSTLPFNVKCLIPKTNFQNATPQNLPFHNSFINNLMDSAKPETLQKLFKTCKLFFKKQPTPICHRFFIASHRETVFWLPTEPPKDEILVFFEKQALTIARDHPCLNDIKNLYLSNNFHVAHSFDENLFSKLLPRIYRAKLNFLTLEDCILTIQEYLFLTKSKTILELNFHGTRVINSDETTAYFEDLMMTLPNACHISIKGKFRPFTYNEHNLIVDLKFKNVVDFNLESFDKTATKFRNSKLRFFEFGTNDFSFNIYSFLEFLKENITYDSHFVMEFIDVKDVELYVTNLYDIINNFLQTSLSYDKKCLKNFSQPYETDCVKLEIK